MPKRSSDQAYLQLMADLVSLRPDEDPPDELFHYTSASGLLEILGSNQIWATNLEFMNDPSEVNYAKKLFWDLVQEEKGLIENELITRFLEDARKAVDPFTTLFSFYAVSFCADGGDRLSQWRGYASEGTGYSIGFHTKDLMKAAEKYQPKNDKQQRQLIKVIYERSQQEDVVRAAVRRICKYIRENLLTCDTHKADESFSWLRNLLCVHLFPYVFSFKHAGFEEEKEWRLVTWIPSPKEAKKVKFRASAKFAIPYISFNLSVGARKGKRKLPISRIIQGPRVEAEIAMKSLKLLSRKYGYSGIEVIPSKIPLR